MPQLQLPVFPVGTTLINSEIGFERREDLVVYLNGHLPVFTHRVDDVASFRLISTQLIENGTATQAEIARAFSVPLTTVKRCIKRYRERGSGAFFAPPVKRQGHKLTPERLVEAQTLLDQGQRVPAISKQLGVLPSTLHKAIDSGRLRQAEKKTP